MIQLLSIVMNLNYYWFDFIVIVRSISQKPIEKFSHCEKNAFFKPKRKLFFAKGHKSKINDTIITQTAIYSTLFVTKNLKVRTESGGQGSFTSQQGKCYKFFLIQNTFSGSKQKLFVDIFV